MKDLSTVQASGLNRRSFPARASLAGGAVLLPQIVVPQSGRAEDKGDNYSWWDEDKKILKFSSRLKLPRHSRRPLTQISSIPRHFLEGCRRMTSYI
jgi:hypothetical protein